MPISVASPRRLAGVSAPLRALVRATLALEGRRAGEIAILLADDEALRGLNRRWRGIDRATDVLSFSYDGPRAPRPGADAVSGDLAISLERMEAQARRFRQSRGRELARLSIHGALHLCGHDHHRPAERDRMRAAERAALSAAAAWVTKLDRALDRE